MIQLLGKRYSKRIAFSFAVIFYLSTVSPTFSMQANATAHFIKQGYSFNRKNSSMNVKSRYRNNHYNNVPGVVENVRKKTSAIPIIVSVANKPDIGGPNQPEMSSFKSISADNMVNSFTGDFNYNIPLLDVGGYPVNIFYDGGVTMEQEASWVGLGWNINPGTISRNMRGVPDDFNGDDTLVETQKMKPNKTWGVNLAADIEGIGIKFLNGGMGVGVSFNNYLGPALDLSIKGGANFSAAGKNSSEKAVPGISVGLSADLNSRSGLTLSPNVSLSGSSESTFTTTTLGVGLSTSYNSRSGLKALQISEQMSLNYKTVKEVCRDENGKIDGMEDGIKSSMRGSILSSGISFTKPSYVPSIRMPLTNTAFAGHFQLGTGMFGGYISGEAEVYSQKTEIADGDVVQRKPLVGYMYYQNAKNNPNAVMDFTRLNDREVTPATPIISAPQYSYDVFSIQGEGTGGNIRAYRNDLGYVRDNYTRSKDKSLDIGGDVGIPGHYGGNFNTIKTPSTISEWNNGNKLRNTNNFGFTDASGLKENVYFRNPGESSVLNNDQFDKIGGTELVRFQLGGSNSSPTVEPSLQKFSKSGTSEGTVSLLTTNPSVSRKKRTQVVSFLTAEEAQKIGLDTVIKSYSTETLLDHDTLVYQPFARISEYRKKHHMSQINVTESDGKRYIYGIPVYNIRQKDFTFSVGDTTGAYMDKVEFNSTDTTTGSDYLATNSSRDGYLQITETPAYAHSFLLSGLLSSDYVDVTGDGITEDDLGEAVKFNYTRIRQDDDWATHKWRSPLTSSTNIANFNDGNKTERKDDKGIISYGERESWYLHSIESKTMIAVFKLGDRNDGKGPKGVKGEIDGDDNSLKKLDSIELYSKSDLKKNGTDAKPIKTVHFVYDYSLCKGTPDNPTSGQGKLTLTKIYFTFNKQQRGNKNQYVFNYGDANSNDQNPSYQFNASDRWGNYKASGWNPQQMKNSDYPYSIQSKARADSSAQAWMLKKILLPSGGQIEVQYEGKDYAFVQNKRATDMMEVTGFGKDSTSITDRLYSISLGGIVENDYVFIHVPEACASKNEVYQKYLQGVEQIAFKLAVQMPKGIEFIRSYATINDDPSHPADRYGVYNSSTIWVKVKKVDGLTPMSMTALQYLREQLPGQAFPGYDVSESSGLEQIGYMMGGWLDGLAGAFQDPIKHFRSKGLARAVVLNQSFARLNDPDGYKYGGGYRVRSIKLKDNWDKMTSQYGSFYGQQYDYTTTESFNGTSRTISSGVASYEPSIGGEENPFHTIIQVSNKVPLGPTSYGAVEMPVLDAFFPAPVVGYSKVTIRSLKKITDTTKKSRSGIGKQVTEFYTAKDFPVYYSNTSFDPLSDKQTHQSSLTSFWTKSAFDSRALSQGFLVETNDMHGKMKSQSSYAENDTLTKINYTENFYRNTGSKGMDEKFDFVYASQNGVVSQGNMGIDIELMNDVREFSVKSSSEEYQGQLDWMFVFPPIWVPFIWTVYGESENVYRAITTTKVISYHSILDSVVVIDKGSVVSTKNLVYDAETGSVVVNRTNNEFKQPIYTTTYPAYWAYSGMGLAYKNIDAVFSHVDFLNGKITSSNVPDSAIESGDELYLLSTGSVGSGCYQTLGSSDSVRLIWAYNKHKDTSSLTDVAPDYVFLDKGGQPYTRTNVKFRIVRSGKRNMLNAQAEGVTTMASPVDKISQKLTINENTNAVNASAVEFREKWQIDNDQIKKQTTLYDSITCARTVIEDCDGYLEKSINPYPKGLLGNFKSYRSMVFYGNRSETNPSVATNLPLNGLLDSFHVYWNFDTYSNLVPDLTNSKWVWNSKITRVNSRGLELETKDALNIYTAAQYGFNKTLPVAIANNARYDEMFNDGFEDEKYSESLNKITLNTCASPHINLREMPNSLVVNTDTADFSAHTGKNVLAIRSGDTASVTIPVKSSVYENYPLLMKKDTVKGLYYTGGLSSKISAIPSTAPVHSPTLTIYNLGMNLDFGGYDVNGQISGSSPGVTRYNVYYKTTQYTQISSPNTYHLTLSAWQGESGGDVFYPSSSIIFSIAYMEIDITKLNGDHVASFTVNNSNSPRTVSVFLGCDIYKIECYCSGDIQRYLTDGGDGGGFHTYGAVLGYSSDIGTTSYQSPYPANLCIYYKPIAGADSMLNPVFSIPANKKMLFSAWVKENCAQPCNAYYANNMVRINFNDGSSKHFELAPSGPIIEGWQRYEQYFDVPADATEATLSFINNDQSHAIYFDDIRLHPFNANMKSYVYDPVNLRLVAELDANNYASFYEYDEEGGLIRTKVETKEGIKTIKETRSAKQKNITTIQ